MPKQQQMAAAMTQLAIDITQDLVQDFSFRAWVQAVFKNEGCLYFLLQMHLQNAWL